VYCLRIPKQQFIEAIFAEMRVELMYKILLFRKTPYFQELSPYSLIIFASICEVKEFKYGEIILSQGQRPEECYLVAHGNC
jgi:signal-transduction protein with cAMP-binding, CBS, and nucleotidyltransferase domain